MGLYNEVSCSCPNCGTPEFLHTKSGTCALKHYPSYSVPPVELEGLDREFYCEECGKGWKIFFEEPRNVSLHFCEIN